jgi:hypothetical protein
LVNAMCTAMVTDWLAGAAPLNFALFTQLATLPVTVVVAGVAAVAVRAMAAAITPPKTNRVLSSLSTRFPFF